MLDKIVIMKTNKFYSRNENTRDDWQTPKKIVKSLGEFDLDPCANAKEPKRLAKNGYTIFQDGLSKKWFGRIWLNPPYGKECRIWINKLAEHGNGIALIPPRIGSKWFHESIFGTCDSIFFHKGRISFLDPNTKQISKQNNADSAFIAFGDNNTQALMNSGLPGKIWIL